MTNDKFIQVCQVEGFINWMDSARVSITKSPHNNGLRVNIDIENDRYDLLGSISFTLSDALTPHQIVALIRSMHDAFRNGQYSGRRIGKSSMQSQLRELLGFND